MSRILIAATGSLGDLHPYLAVGLELSARGHAVTIATSETYRAKVDATGLSFAPMGPHLGLESSEIMTAAMERKTGPEYLIRRVLYPAIPAAYPEVMEALSGADLLVTHPLAFSAHIAAETTRVPWLSTVLSPLSFFSRFDPPVPAPYPMLAKLRPLGPAVNGFLLNLGRRMTRSWMEPVTRFRATLGLPPGGDPILEGQFSPRLVLAMFSPVLGRPQPDWPPNTVVTGFAPYDQAEHGRGLDPGLERFLDDGPPPVVFTLGSAAVLTAGSFYRESIDAIARTGGRAVLLAGDNALPSPLPPGIAAFAYAPFSRIFPRAAATVHPGGIGTTAQALLAGRPMLVVPYAFDQPDNAARLERLGVAVSVPRDRYDGRRAAAALDRLATDSAFAASASRLARIVAAEDGIRAAADRIEAA